MSVFRAVNATHAVALQFADFGRDDHAAAAAKDLDMRAAPTFEQVHHVLEILYMPALVRADSNALHVFLQSGGDHLFDAAVMTQVDDFCAHALQNAAHDVDGCVMPVKQAGGGHKAHFVRGPVIGKRLEFCG